MVQKLDDGMCKLEFVNLIFTTGLLEIQEFCQILSLGKKKICHSYSLLLISQGYALLVLGLLWNISQLSRMGGGQYIFLSPNTFTKLCLEIKTV